MKRFKPDQNRARKHFNYTANHTNAYNVHNYQMRGGIRL